MFAVLEASQRPHSAAALLASCAEAQVQNLRPLQLAAMKCYARASAGVRRGHARSSTSSCPACARQTRTCTGCTSRSRGGSRAGRRCSAGPQPAAGRTAGRGFFLLVKGAHGRSGCVHTGRLAEALAQQPELKDDPQVQQYLKAAKSGGRSAPGSQPGSSRPAAPSSQSSSRRRAQPTANGPSSR